MFFFFLIGCPTKIKQGDDRTVRVCPKCRNNAVVSGKKRTWLEVFFIPVVPIHSANVWVCTICSWQVDQKSGQLEPPQAGYPGAQGQAYQPQPGQPQYKHQPPAAHPMPGYQPGYQQHGFAQAYPAQR